MFNRTKQLLRWGWKGIEVWNLLISIGVPAVIRAIFRTFFEGWMWYDQLLFVAGFVCIILAILIVLFRDQTKKKDVSNQLEQKRDSEYEDSRKEQEGHEEQWLRLVIEWIDFKSSGLLSKQIVLKYQIDSGLAYDFKPYRMWLKLKIGTYEPKDGWEILQTPNLLKRKRSQFASETFTVNDDDLLKLIEGCRQGLQIAQTLKVIMQLRAGDNLRTLESSYSINPYSEFVQEK